MPRIVLIVQARMGSKRLPGKSLMSLAGEPLVFRVLERLKRCKLISNLVLAVPETKEDEKLIHLAVNSEVDVFVGPEEDVLERYRLAAIEYKADYVVRIPADNPVPEPSEIDRIIRHHLDLGRPGFSSNLSVIFNSGYPDGIGAEIFDFECLMAASLSCPTQKQREHVHLNFFDYESQRAVDPVRFPVSTVKCPIAFRRPDLILDVNTLPQYQYMGQLYDALYPTNPAFSILDVIQWHDQFTSC